MAFDAILERFSRQEVAVLEYHVHIPLPDPMTNPSTEARAKFCDAQGTPTYAIDGEKATGGAARDEAKEFYDKLDTQIVKRLDKPAEARLSLEASLQGGLVKVKAGVDKLASKSPDLMLQIALVEDGLSYSGENGLRFHPMVVRSLGGEKAEGFPIAPLKVTAIEHTFDLGKITRELKAYLEDYEKEHKQAFYYMKDKEKGFLQKKYEINEGRLSVAAFIQDKKTKNVLQAAFVKLKAEGAGSSR